MQHHPDGRDEIQLQHTHRKASIEQLVQIAVIDTMSEPGTKPLKMTEKEVVLQKMRHIDKNIARMLGLPTKIPYREITRFDEENKMFTMETHIEIESVSGRRRSYTLDVITAYEENETGKVDVKARLFCGGVPRNSIMHMGLTAYVREQFKNGRQQEEVALLAK
jgi:hypothetical protein